MEELRSSKRVVSTIVNDCPVYIPEMQEAELMYKLFDLVSGNLEEVNEYLKQL